MKARLLDNVEDDMWMNIVPRPSQRPRRVQRRKRSEVHPFLVPEVSDSEEEELVEEQIQRAVAPPEPDPEESLPRSWSIQKRKRCSNVPTDVLGQISSVSSSESLHDGSAYA